MNNAYIVKSAKFFPNAPVPNDDMERHLGLINGQPSKARRIILKKNGIENRYYALDNNGNVTHTNVEMAAEAIRGLLNKCKLSIDDIDVLSCGTATPEQLVPSHGVMVHGALGGNKNIEVVSFAGSCCAGMGALKYAYLQVLSGLAKRAIASASERTSAWLKASYFQKESEELLKQVEAKPMLAFEKEFLRWMLSDGAMALMLEDQPAANGLSLRIEWIEMTSYANKMETCMYAGAEKQTDGSMKGWAMFSEDEWLTKSIFAIKQDTRILGEYIIGLGCDYLKELVEKHQLKADQIDWFLPHLSSMFFKDMVTDGMKKIGFVIPEERWFLNLSRVGNIASASAYAMLDELMDSGQLKKGQKILMMVPESARFSYCYCLLTVC